MAILSPNNHFTVLITPTNYFGVPFDFFGRTPIIMAAFITDVVASSLYLTFERLNKQKYYAILTGGLLFFMLETILSMTVAIVFYTTYASGLIFVLTLLSPLIVMESMAGSYLGYKIYRRIT
jgi:LytS/YehU family sensor histidine kinase